MKKAYNRRNFIKNSVITGVGLSVSASVSPLFTNARSASGKRIGIIGLDTSHSVEFTKILNTGTPPPEYQGYKIAAAYPKGSLDIESSVKRIPGYTDKVKEMGVEIVDSVEALLEKVDVVLLETNDGRRHFEQAMPVLKAGKKMFIDKPIAASLTDAIAIFEAAKHYKVPVFSSSTLRYMSTAQDVVNGKIGKVVGADAYSPCVLEKTHPDFFWYGIHGVEILYTVMGTGCKELTRTHTENTDIIVGQWADGRVGTVRGTRTGKHLYGGTAYGENGNAVLGPVEGYEPLLKEIVRFFDTGIAPIKAEETLEMFTFMEAADESKRKKGSVIQLQDVWKKAHAAAQAKLKKVY